VGQDGILRRVVNPPRARSPESRTPTVHSHPSATLISFYAYPITESYTPKCTNITLVYLYTLSSGKSLHTVSANTLAYGLQILWPLE